MEDVLDLGIEAPEDPICATPTHPFSSSSSASASSGKPSSVAPHTPTVGKGAAGTKPSLASITVDLPNGGILKYFDADRRFEATCANDQHKTANGHKCRLTRYIPEKFAADQPHRGRCIGQLAAWLLDSFKDGFKNNADRVNKFYVRTLDRSDRKAARQMIYELSSGLPLKICEPPKLTESEDSEPEDIY